MAHYVGIDASFETVNVCVVDDDGTVCLERKIEAERQAIIKLLKDFGKPIARLGLEAGPTASWLYSELRAAGLPAICMECRHVKAGLGAMRNKTDRNDARGIAQPVRLDRLCIQLARSDPICRRLMTVPGAGVIVALTHVTGVDAPERFR